MDKILKKIFVFMIKYLPVMQMAGILLNNIIWYIVDETISMCIDIFIGNSIGTTIALLVASYTFGFCKWHRLVILANFINIMLILFDVIFNFNITNIQRILSYLTIDIIFLIIIIIIKFKCKK